LAERIADDATARRQDAPTPEKIRVNAGTVLIREWHGTKHQVTVLNDGFLFRAKRFRSLSQIARAITGSRWSGPLFFGLKAAKKEQADIEEGLIDVVVVYKVDRLTRSLSDFARMVEIFDEHRVSFVAVTQQFNTTTSMGRLTLNVLLSFAQFEREVTGERIRDKIAASKRKGMWMGGLVPLGYEVRERQLAVC
jgi:DUF2924 family protein/resolvase-like protein